MIVNKYMGADNSHMRVWDTHRASFQGVQFGKWREEGDFALEKPGKTLRPKWWQSTSRAVNHVDGGTLDMVQWECSVPLWSSSPKTRHPSLIKMREMSDKSQMRDVLRNSWPVLKTVNGHQKKASPRNCHNHEEAMEIWLHLPRGSHGDIHIRVSWVRLDSK